MARWEPDAPGRLAAAALDLFEERGYDRTTVEDIAARAGVTRRTFFRHFADKREALFDRGEGFERDFVAGARAAPPDATPMEAVAATLAGTTGFFIDRHAHSARRHRVIAATPELQERELVKLAKVTAALAEVLRERGVAPPVAGVLAEAGMGVFRTALERWALGDGKTELGPFVEESLRTLREAVGA